MGHQCRGQLALLRPLLAQPLQSSRPRRPGDRLRRTDRRLFALPSWSVPLRPRFNDGRWAPGHDNARSPADSRRCTASSNKPWPLRPRHPYPSRRSGPVRAPEDPPSSRPILRGVRRRRRRGRARRAGSSGLPRAPPPSQIPGLHRAGGRRCTQSAHCFQGPRDLEASAATSAAECCQRAGRRFARPPRARRRERAERRLSGRRQLQVRRPGLGRTTRTRRAGSAGAYGRSLCEHCGGRGRLGDGADRELTPSRAAPIAQAAWWFSVPSERHWCRQARVLWKAVANERPSFSDPAAAECRGDRGSGTDSAGASGLLLSARDRS